MRVNTTIDVGRYISWGFFGIYVNFVRNCNKRHFFSVCLYFLLTVTGRNEAIIVELKELFVLNTTFITYSGGYNHYFFRNYEKWCQLSPLFP